MSNPLDTFRSEAEDHLSNIESALLEMEDAPTNPDLVAQCFRSLHTIKGAGGMFGFDELSEFTHHLETAFDKIRNGQYPVTPELISVMLDAKDHIAGMLDKPEQSQVLSLVGQSLLARLHEIIPGDDAAPAAAKKRETNPQTAAQGSETVFRIRFSPCASSFSDGFDVLPQLTELQSLGKCYVTTIDDKVPSLEDLDPQSCHLSWDIILVTPQSIDAVNDTFIFVADDWQIW